MAVDQSSKRVSAISATAKKIQSLIEMSGNCQVNLVLFCNVRKMWPFLLRFKNGGTYLGHHFSPSYHYLFCEIFMVEKSKD